MPNLFNNKTENGDSFLVEWNGNSFPGTVQINGVWDGAIATIRGSMNRGETFVAPENSTFTDDVITAFQMGNGVVKVTISNAGEETNLSAYISPG